MDKKELIAQRAAKEIFDGALVNLGFGIPVLISKYAKNAVLYGENGIIGYQAGTSKNPNIIDGGTNWAEVKKGTCFVDSATSFAIVRGGHLDITVLGALQVSEKGDLANWSMSFSGVGGVGGAVDMATCAKKVIVAMEHVDRNGNPKIVKSCTFPLTATECVDLIITDMAVIEVRNGKLWLKELLNGCTFEEVQNCTGTLISR